MYRVRALEADLIRWRTGNAVVIGIAAVACALGKPIGLLSAVGAISFATLLSAFRHRWTPDGRFGLANVITFARIGGILALPALRPGLPAALAALGLFALDGLDGRIARSRRLAGPFGELADKEGDALLVLVLCLLLYRPPAGLGAWVLLPGMLRYAYVLFIALAAPPRRNESRSLLGACIGGFMISALIAAVAAYPAYIRPAAWLVAAATALLCCSFAESAWQLYGKPSVETK